MCPLRSWSLVIHQEQHMWRTSILLQFWLSNEKKNAEYHRYAYSNSLARAFEILWADQRDRCLKSKKHTVIVLVKLDVLNYFAILFCRWSRGLEQLDQLDVRLKAEKYFSLTAKQSFIVRTRATQSISEQKGPPGERVSRLSHARYSRLRPTGMWGSHTSQDLAFAVVVDGWLRSQKISISKVLF